MVVSSKSSEFLNWVFVNKDKLGIRIKELTWTRDWAPELFEFSTYIFHNGIHIYGRGTDSDKEMALVKSLSELFERCVQVDNGIENSNGLAAHTDREWAKKYSKDELIERDIFLNRFISGSTIPRMNFSNQWKGGAYNSFYKKIIDNGVKVAAYALGSYLDYKCVMVVCHDSQSRFGLSVGVGLEDCVFKSIEKACMESFRRVVWAIETETLDSKNLREFELIERPTHESHMKLALNVEYANLLLKQMGESYGGFDNFENKNIEINYKELFLKNKKFKSCPLFFYQSHSNELQNMFTGIMENNKINIGRYTSLNFLKPFKSGCILPHPLA